jgi:GTP-binding protein
VADFAGLGFPEVYPVSAEHGIGVAELLDAIVAALPGAPAPGEGGEAPRIAVVGRPNVGKSTLINFFLKEERLVTDDRPGTTRDAIDTAFSFGEREYVLIDTAGIRRSGKVADAVERVSVRRAEDSIYRAEVCLIVLDATELVTDQDARVAGLVHEARRGCLFLVNKWDAAGDLTKDEARLRIREKLNFMDYAPVLFVSARTGLGTHKVFPAVEAIFEQFTRSIPTHELNTFLWETVRAYKPGSYHGKTVTFGYMTQDRTRPPTFTILTNDPKRVHLSYRRYLVNRLQEKYGFTGIPVVLRFRARKEKDQGRGRVPENETD